MRIDQNNKYVRYTAHIRRTKKFYDNEEILDPKRIVNRIMYGTDYNPKEVKFNFNKINR